MTRDDLFRDLQVGSLAVLVTACSSPESSAHRWGDPGDSSDGTAENRDTPFPGTGGVAEGTGGATGGSYIFAGSGGDTPVDMDGVGCAPCDPGASCVVDSDCASGNCDAGRCQAGAGTCLDYTTNQNESDQDCGGSCSYACFNKQSCNTDGDCQSENCVSELCEGPSGYHSDIVRLVSADLSEFNNVPNGWLDSYSHNGACYCIGGNDHDTDTVFVDTPFGTWDVKTLCEIFDEARDLELIPKRQGSDPIYNDVQCGNGPANSAPDEAPGTGCPGRVDIANADGCNQAGPTWDLRFMSYIDLSKYR